MRLNKRVIVAGLASVAILPTAALADSFTVHSGETVTTLQTLSNSGDVGTIELGGTLSFSGGYGPRRHFIEASATGVTVNNAGYIIANNLAVRAEADYFTFINSGSIRAQDGINMRSYNDVTNSGEIYINDGGDNGITTNDYNTIRNSGLISAVYDGVSMGSYNSLYNDGTIETRMTGFEDSGVYAGSFNTIINRGLISSPGSAQRYDIALQVDEGNYILNEGTISASGSEGTGVRLGVNNNTLINTGAIIGGRTAVVSYGSGNTVSLLFGSSVEGLLDIEGTGGNTLSIGPRLNTALTYTYGQEVIIETDGMPYVAHNGVLAVVDPTLFAAWDGIVGDLTRSVGGLVDARLGAAAGQGGNIVVSTSNAPTDGSQWQAWATGIGSYRNQNAEGLNDGFDSTLGGFALGADTVLSSGTRFGGFVGASSTHLLTDAGNEQVDATSTYVGLYSGYTLPNAFVNLGLMAGHATAETSRDVLNNMVDGGIEQAKGAPDGMFIAPQATVGTQIKTANGVMTPSLRVAYTRLSMGSYDETGSTADLSVASRTVSTLDMRGQVAFAIKPIVTKAGVLDATLRLGADMTFSNSDEIAATLLGQPITLNTSQDTALRGFAGLDLAQKLDNGAMLKLSVEAGADTSSAVTVKGTAGLEWAF